MNEPLPDYHSNPETFKLEPVYIFTDKAIVPVKKKGPPSEPAGEEKAPPTEKTDEGKQG